VGGGVAGEPQELQSAINPKIIKVAEKSFILFQVLLDE
jgi:hypothetical protein